MRFLNFLGLLFLFNCVFCLNSLAQFDIKGTTYDADLSKTIVQPINVSVDGNSYLISYNLEIKNKQQAYIELHVKTSETTKRLFSVGGDAGWVSSGKNEMFWKKGSDGIPLDGFIQFFVVVSDLKETEPKKSKEKKVKNTTTKNYNRSYELDLEFGYGALRPSPKEGFAKEARVDSSDIKWKSRDVYAMNLRHRFQLSASSGIVLTTGYSRNKFKLGASLHMSDNNDTLLTTESYINKQVYSLNMVNLGLEYSLKASDQFYFTAGVCANYIVSGKLDESIEHTLNMDYLNASFGDDSETTLMESSKFSLLDGVVGLGEVKRDVTSYQLGAVMSLSYYGESQKVAFRLEGKYFPEDLLTSQGDNGFFELENTSPVVIMGYISFALFRTK